MSADEGVNGVDGDGVISEDVLAVDDVVFEALLMAFAAETISDARFDVPLLVIDEETAGVVELLEGSTGEALLPYPAGPGDADGVGLALGSDRWSGGELLAVGWYAGGIGDEAGSGVPGFAVGGIGGETETTGGEGGCNDAGGGDGGWTTGGRGADGGRTEAGGGEGG